MPWNQTDTMNERLKFIAAWQSDTYSFSELCRQFGISRKTGYKLIERYQAVGPDGLKDQSRAHHSHPHTTPDEIQRDILNFKHKYPKWGPKKIKTRLELINPSVKWPATSTIGEILKTHGLVEPRKKRNKVPPYTKPFEECTHPNRVWSADYKGHFKMGDGQRCYPLTISDNNSRFLLTCQGLYLPSYEPTRAYFEKAFKIYGLPDVIRTDNGAPFASVGIGGLSRLSIWWIKLNILPERIKPGHPEQNGRHERMHRTLKAHTASPSKKNLRAQQRAFDQFINEYNNERPHEALHGKTPADFYKSSPREYPAKISEIEYASDLEVRRVRSNGEIKWKGKKIFISESLYQEAIGLEKIDEDKWQLYFSKMKIGVLDERKWKIVRPD